MKGTSAATSGATHADYAFFPVIFKYAQVHTLVFACPSTFVDTKSGPSDSYYDN
jgi:hypothetical protein